MHLQGTDTVGAMLQAVILHNVDLAQLKRLSFAPPVARLGSTLPFLMRLAWQSGRLDNVRRRRLGGVGRVFRSRCELGYDVRESLLQRSDLALQLATSRTARLFRLISHDGVKLTHQARDHQDQFGRRERLQRRHSRKNQLFR